MIKICVWWLIMKTIEIRGIVKIKDDCVMIKRDIGVLIWSACNYDFCMMVMIWEGERDHTSAGSDCGICCSEKACLGNQRRRTCSKRFEDPPLVLVSQGWMKKRRGKIGEFGGWERERERPRKPKSKQEPKKEREYNHSEKREETQEKRGERNRDRESLHFI